MVAIHRLFTNGHSKTELSEEVEIAVNGVLREAEELCQLLRKRREKQEKSVPAKAIHSHGVTGA
jgi:hypothetical protein